MKRLLPLLFFASTSHAVTVGNSELPDTWPLGNETLVLNGAGLREYSFLRIAVYAGALYVPKREANADAILDATTPRVIHMKMLRDVSREDSIKAWQHYLDANCTVPCAKDSTTFKLALAEFRRITPETRFGDTQTFVFRDGNAEWLRNGVKLGEIRDASFARTLLACWIGRVPTTEDLRAALLGSKK
jgi:hypothetical protein